MQMGPKEIAVEYRTAANRQKQIKVLAQLNQCAERKIAEILAAEGEELPKKWQEQLRKPSRRSWKYPESEATPEDDAPAPVSPADRATDRDLFEAVATLLPDGSRVEKAPEAMPEKQDEKASVEEAEEKATVTLDPSAWNRAVERKIEPGEISAETLLRAACRMLTFALDLEPEKYHVYSCGVLDLVHALTEEG